MKKKRQSKVVGVELRASGGLHGHEKLGWWHGKKAWKSNEDTTTKLKTLTNEDKWRIITTKWRSTLQKALEVLPSKYHRWELNKLFPSRKDISKHKYKNYGNQCKFIDNKWLTAIKVVYMREVGGGGGGGGWGGGCRRYWAKNLSESFTYKHFSIFKKTLRLI